MVEACTIRPAPRSDEETCMTTSMEPQNADIIGKPDNWVDPYPAYRQYREQSPVSCELAQFNLSGVEIKFRAWVLLKFDDVFKALRDHATFSSQNPAQGEFAPKLALIQDDPPRHTRFRRLVNKAFTARRIAELEPWIASVADALLKEIGEQS